MAPATSGLQTRGQGTAETGPVQYPVVVHAWTIKMIETTIDEVKKYISQIEWDKLFQVKRNELLKNYAYSVMVEASYMEIDTAEKWLENSVGLKHGLWDWDFYYKQAYDYGYAEFFFKEEKSKEIFKKEIPKFYGVWPDGKEFRTTGWDQFLDVE